MAITTGEWRRRGVIVVMGSIHSQVVKGHCRRNISKVSINYPFMKTLIKFWKHSDKLGFAESLDSIKFLARLGVK
jgi:hypothetical protein